MENRAVKILAIDDNKDNLTIMKALIMEAFPKSIVLTALTGQKGLEIAEKEEPDVILLDIIMPGMDGYEICRKLKADKKLFDIPVVFVTAIISDKTSRIKALESGVDGFLTKPIDESELTALIRAMIKIRGANTQKRYEMLRLEEKSQENEYRFQSLFNRMSSGAAIYKVLNNGSSGKDYIIMDFNETALIMEGKKKSHVQGKSLNDLRPNIDNYGLIPVFQKVWLTGQPAHFPSKVYIDEKYNNWYENRIFKLPSGEIVAIYDDVTDKMMIQEKLEESEARYRQIAENVTDVIWTADMDMRTTYISPSVEKMLGESPEAHMRKTVEEKLTPDSLKIVHEVFLEELEKEKDLKSDKNRSRIIEVEHYRADGSVIWVSMHSSYLRDENGKVIGFQGVSRDITERKQTENELLRFAEELEQQRIDLEKRLHQSVKAISKIGELRDVYTAGHQKRVAELACAIGREMGLVAEQIHNLSFGALIHDIGKFFIPSDILNKPCTISALEYQIIQTHVEESYNVVKEIDFPEEIHTMIFQHHERLDGSGYPQGLSCDEIILQSRIIAVADVVEAMSSHRPYRSALGIDAALDEILMNKGIKYDADVVDICVKLFREKKFCFE